MGICCFSAKNAELKRKGKDWLARNKDSMSEGRRGRGGEGVMSICGLLFE
jgi:hypothetical protein